MLGWLVKAVVWDDAIVWVFVRRDVPKKDQTIFFRGYLDFREVTIAEIGEILYNIFEKQIIPSHLVLEGAKLRQLAKRC